MKIAIIGTGHVGLISGLGFAHFGHEVICQDIDENKIKALQIGKLPIYEPHAEELLHRHKDKIQFSTDLKEAVDQAEVLFICVGTPPGTRGESNLTYVEAVARQIAECATPGTYRLIVDKSTVPIKTAERVRQTLDLYGDPGTIFGVASNPEFLQEGHAVSGTLKPDRIVVGISSAKDAALMREVYDHVINETRYIETDVRSAELIKHVANAYLSTRLSFINLVAQICDATGANIDEVLRGITPDARIGESFIQPGIGYGGSCFPKDVPAFAHIAEENQIDASLLWSVHEINNNQIDWFFEKIKQKLWSLKNKKIAVWGLAFKRDTDDVRESPALKLVQRLLKEDAEVQIYDPHAQETGLDALKQYNEDGSWYLPENLTFVKDKFSCLDQADALVVATEWLEFMKADPIEVKKRLRLPIVFDGKNILIPKSWEEAGFTYIGVGR